MKFKVDKDICIGCGACNAICPDVFEINDDGLSEVVVETVPEEQKESAIEAIESCPTEAIKEIEVNESIIISSEEFENWQSENNKD